MKTPNTPMNQCGLAASTLFVALATAGLYGQSTPTRLFPDRGITPTGEYAGGTPDTISVVSGNLHLRIPLASFPAGRTNFFNVELLYDSGIYEITPVPATDRDGNTVIANQLTNSSTGGWRYNFQNLKLVTRERRLPEYCASTQEISRSERTHSFSVGLLDGGLHSLTPRGFADEIGDAHLDDGYYGVSPLGFTYNCSGISPQHYPQTGFQHLYLYTSDSTFTQVHLDTSDDAATPGIDSRWTAHFPDGRTIAARDEPWKQRVISDPNGNSVSINFWCEDPNCLGQTYTEVLSSDGAVINVTYDYDPHNRPRTDRIRITAPNGGFHDAFVEWMYVLPTPAELQQGKYSCAPQVQCPFGLGHRVVKQIHLPTSSTPMVFGYDLLGWGELNAYLNPFLTKSNANSIAGLEWEWENRTATKSITDLTRNRVIKRKLTHDGITETWGYSYPAESTQPGLLQTTVRYPDPGGAATNYFYGSSGESVGSRRAHRWG